MARTGFVWDEQYVWFDSRGYHDWLPREALFQPLPSPETPEGKRRFKNLLDAAGITPQLVAIAPRMATRAEIERLHDPAFQVAQFFQIKHLALEDGPKRSTDLAGSDQIAIQIRETRRGHLQGTGKAHPLADLPPETGGDRLERRCLE